MLANRLMLRDTVYYSGEMSQILQLANDVFDKQIRPVCFSEDLLIKLGFEKIPNSLNNDVSQLLFIKYKESEEKGVKWYKIALLVVKDETNKFRYDKVKIQIQCDESDITLYNKKYLHELQQALKISELDNLANSLIIKEDGK